MTAEAQALRDDVLAFLATPLTERREALALRIHDFQRHSQPALRRWCTGPPPRSIQEIPCLPVGVFRRVRLCSGPTVHVFRTSGTTSGQRGEHHLPDLEALHQASLRWFQAVLPHAPAHAVSLVSHADDASLGHMVALFYPQATRHFSPESGLDVASAWSTLANTTHPVFVAATAFALDALLAAGGRAELAPGSVLMVTGGFKGRRRSLEEVDMGAAVRRQLGPHLRTVGEYGMTELSSQLWDTGQGYRPPPWLLPSAGDPVTGRALPDGQPGVLRFVDLASWGSCLAIETQDGGVVHPDGRVELLGRLPGSPARGCSLTAEEAE